MKNIKDLKIKSIEDLEVRNVKTFPSMEWGEDGGLEADIYYQGKFAVRIFQEGNGGCALDTERDDAVLKAAKPSILAILKRLDKAYSYYSWLKTKTVENLDADDYESVANLFIEQYDLIKDAKKGFKKGCATFIAIISGSVICTSTSMYNMSKQYVAKLIELGHFKGVSNDYDRLVVLTAADINNAF